MPDCNHEEADTRVMRPQWPCDVWLQPWGSRYQRNEASTTLWCLTATMRKQTPEKWGLNDPVMPDCNHEEADTREMRPQWPCDAWLQPWGSRHQSNEASMTLWCLTATMRKQTPEKWGLNDPVMPDCNHEEADTREICTYYILWSRECKHLKYVLSTLIDYHSCWCILWFNLDSPLAEIRLTPLQRSDSPPCRDQTHPLAEIRLTPLQRSDSPPCRDQSRPLAEIRVAFGIGNFRFYSINALES